MIKGTPWEPTLTNIASFCDLFLFLKCGLVRVHICEVQGLQAFNALFTYISFPVLFIGFGLFAYFIDMAKIMKRWFAKLRVKAGDIYTVFRVAEEKAVIPIHSFIQLVVIKHLLIIKPWTAGNLLANDRKSLPSWDLCFRIQINK